jgi:hypothetical protein
MRGVRLGVQRSQLRPLSEALPIPGDDELRRDLSSFAGSSSVTALSAYLRAVANRNSECDRFSKETTLK